LWLILYKTYFIDKNVNLCTFNWNFCWSSLVSFNPLIIYSQYSESYFYKTTATLIVHIITMASGEGGLLLRRFTACLLLIGKLLFITTAKPGLVILHKESLCTVHKLPICTPPISLYTPPKVHHNIWVRLLCISPKTIV
jgi:hypothetical protein